MLYYFIILLWKYTFIHKLIMYIYCAIIVGYLSKILFF